LRLEYSLWGLDTTGYHWVNILLHGANALLLWQLLRKLSIPGAWLAAAIWALHPVQVESVAWVTELKNILMCFFFLLALLAWVDFVDGKPERKWSNYMVAIVCCALSLFSKTTACTLPAALLLIFWLKNRPLHFRRWMEIAPFVGMGMGMGLLTTWWERFHQGTQGKLFAMGIPDRLLLMSHAIWFYAGKLAWPVNLTFSYPRWNISVTDPWAYFWPALTVVCGLLIYYLRRYVGRSVEVGALFFVSTLVPVSGAIMLYTFLYSFVADHYQYVASIGLIALAAAGISIAVDSRQKIPMLVAGTGLVLLLAVLTWRQCGMYADVNTLWRATLERNPGSWMAHNNLGNCLRQEGKFDEAMAQYHEALRSEPDNTRTLYNIGTALMQKGRVDDAITQYRQVIQVDPNYLDAYINLGDALLKEGKVDDAMAQYLTALKIRPNDAMAHYDLGTVLVRQGKLDEGIAQFERAVQIEPDNAEAQGNLGCALAQEGRLDEAITHFQEAMRIDPRNAEVCNNLGHALLQQGRAGAAFASFKDAVQLKPDCAEACDSLAWMLATVSEASWRDGKRAVELAQRANQLAKGQNPSFLRTLAAADAELQRFDEAIQNAQAAMKLAQASGQTNLVEYLNGDLKLYSAGRSFPSGK
jgi:tetratricopeptide (TPR) repeat protein